MRTLSIAMAGLLGGCFFGCEAAPLPQAADMTESAPSPPPPAAPAEPAVAEAPKPTSRQKGDAVLKAAAAKRAAKAAESDAPADGAPADAAEMEEDDAEAAPDGELSKAEVGVGAKGQDYGGPGFVTTPIETMFRAEERIRFEAQIPNAMKIYKASHDNKGPATHEEFMKVIIEEAGIPLPELPQGSEYWYDVKTEQLMVRTPKPAE